eukprot:COSAG01_NODE_21934_length_878_cov_3.510911_1_plen_81_part_00
MQSSPPDEGASDSGGRNIGKTTGQSKYVALDKRDSKHWKRKNFNGAQDRNRHIVNTISNLGSTSIVQATAAWLRGMCGLE